MQVSPVGSSDDMMTSLFALRLFNNIGAERMRSAGKKPFGQQGMPGAQGASPSTQLGGVQGIQPRQNMLSPLGGSQPGGGQSGGGNTINNFGVMININIINVVA